MSDISVKCLISPILTYNELSFDEATNTHYLPTQNVILRIVLLNDDTRHNWWAPHNSPIFDRASKSSLVGRNINVKNDTKALAA